MSSPLKLRARFESLVGMGSEGLSISNLAKRLLGRRESSSVKSFNLNEVTELAYMYDEGVLFVNAQGKEDLEAEAFFDRTLPLKKTSVEELTLKYPEVEFSPASISKEDLVRRLHTSIVKPPTAFSKILSNRFQITQLAEYLPELTIRIDAAGWSTKGGQHPMAPEIGYKPTQALLERTRAFTAVFCFNDIAAIGAIRALKDAGLNVPGDVSVVGFDDILSAAYATPSLTTVRQPLAEMGRRGAKVLLERIADRKKPFATDIFMESELIVRESTGPVKPRN